jgi:hypothetical protein
MKVRTLIVIAVSLVLCQGALANLLTNPGLETGDMTGWVNGGSQWSVGSGADDKHTGNYGLLAWIQPATGFGWTAVEQYIPVTAGEGYNLSYYTSAFVFGTPHTEGFLEVSFRDSANGIISQFETTHITATTPWTQGTMSGLIAPIGSVTAVVKGVVHMSGTTDDNAFYHFDDFDMAAIPEPGTLALFGLGIMGLLRLRRKASK